MYVSRKLLTEVLCHLEQIQGSHKGSIGGVDNAYLPQLNRGLMDGLTSKVRETLYPSDFEGLASRVGMKKERG